MRRLLLVGVLVVASAATAAQAQPTRWEEHLLGRYGYGWDNWTLSRLRALGRPAYVEEQLRPGTIHDGPLNQALADPAFDALRMDLPQLRATYGRGGALPPWRARQVMQVELVQRAVTSRRQLQALLTEFWFNHFNVSLDGDSALFTVPYVRNTIRPRVLGRFEDLLLAVARAPAMLMYLDNWRNARQGWVAPNGTVHGLNENYARELLELHTLGVDDQAGVYTQRDVIELARCLTGWTIAWNQASTTGYVFHGPRHDQGPKQVMGLQLAANGGQSDGVRAIRYLARHPRTATFICRKLVTFFVGPGQHTALLNAARQRWNATQGDLREVLRTILLSSELAGARDAKLKRPLMLMTSALRAVNADLGSGQQRYDGLVHMIWDIGQMGQPLLQVSPPTGWSDDNLAWSTPGFAMERINAGEEWLGLHSRAWPTRWRNTSGPSGMATAVLDRLLGRDGARAQTKSALTSCLQSLSIADPARRLRVALALASATREFNHY